MLPALPIPTRSPIRLTGLEPELDMLLGRASVDGPLVIDAGIESGGYWQRDRLGDTCAALAHPVALTRTNASLAGKDWASLVRFAEDGVNSIRDIVRMQDGGRTEVTLFNQPSSVVCPQLLYDDNASSNAGSASGRFRLPAPRFFPTDYELSLLEPFATSATRPGDRAKLQMPGLFVSPAGTHTHVHVDAGCTRFYLLQLSGRKRFRVFAPWEADAHLGRQPNGHFLADVIRRATHARRSNPGAFRWPVHQ